MTPEEQQQQLQAFFESLAKSGTRLGQSFEGLVDQLKKGKISQDQFDKELKKSIDSIKNKTNPGMLTFANNLIKGNKQFQSMQEEIAELNKAIESATDASTKARLEGERDALARKENNNRIIHTTAQYTADMGKVLVGGVANAVGGLIKSLQADGSSTEITKGLMNATIDMANGAAQATGSMVSASGQALQAGAGFAKSAKVKTGLLVAGLALDVFGNSVKAAGDGMSKLAKFGVEILSAEVEKTVKAFNDMSNSGAIFANGMQGMRDASLGAGLTVEQFSRVVQKNSKEFAESGLGVAQGAAAVGRVGKILRDSGIQTQLLNLGYSFEEQAALTAETVANMRRAAGGKVSDAAVAEQTQKYAENLRTIAQITGEDAKAKTKAVEQENSKLAFQQKLAGMSEEQRAQINAAMATMTEQERANLRDRVVFNGEVINQEGAIAESMNSAFAEKGRAAYELLLQGNLTAKANADLNVQYGDAIRESWLAQKEFGVAAYAAGGQLAEVAKAAMDSINQANTYTKDAVEATKKAQEGVKTTGDELTTNMQLAARAAQDLKLQMQAMMDGPIASFANVSAEMLKSLRTMIDQAMGTTTAGSSSSAKAEDTSWWSRNGRSIIETGMGLVGGIAGGTLGGLAGGGVASAVTGTAGAIGGEMLGSAAGSWIANMLGLKPGPGKASGGIAEGPTSGYLEKLHGTEAVIPTVGGKVPIDLRGDFGFGGLANLGKSLSELSGGSVIDKITSMVTGGSGSSSDTSAKIDAAQFQNNMLSLMEKFVEEQRYLSSKLDEQIRQTEKLVVAAT